MKLPIFCLLFLTQNLIGQNVNHFVYLSDLFVAKSISNSLKTKEQNKFFLELIDFSKKTNGLNILESDYNRLPICLNNRLFLTRREILNENSTSNTTLNSAQKENLKILFLLKYYILSRFAYIDDKIVVFHKTYNKTLENCLNNSKFDIVYEIKKILSRLEDPHLMLKIKNEDTQPPVLKAKQVFVYPFQFMQNSATEIYIELIPELNKLSTKWNGASLTHINKIPIKKVLDSIEIKYGPLGSGQFGVVTDYLKLYMFVEGINEFHLKSPNSMNDTIINIERQPISLDQYYNYFSTKKQLPNLFSKGKFHFIKYYEAKNQDLHDLLMKSNSNDTIIIDFRAYPKHDLIKATLLLTSGKPEKVAYSSDLNERNLCFDKIETYDYVNDRNETLSNQINKKRLYIIGLMDNKSGSYVETAIMTLKTYNKDNLILMGQPSVGAHGTIDKVDISENFTLQYPSHKFDFYYTKQLNEKKQIIPDIIKTNKEINEWLEMKIKGKK